MATIRLTWSATIGAIQYNIYHATAPGLSIARTPLLATTTELTYDHTGLSAGSAHYYIVAGVGPNGEISAPSSEIGKVTAILISITVTPANPTIIATGGTQQMTATGHYSDSSTQNITGSVTWSSGTPSNATISPGGLVTAIAIGTSLITATLGIISGNTTATITIALNAIVVTPANISLALGLEQQYTATGHYSDSSTADITSTVTWSTSDLDLAIISNNLISPVPNVISNGTFETGDLTNWSITTGTLALPQYTFGNPLDLGGDDSDPNPYLSNVSIINTDSHSGTYSMMVGSSDNAPEMAGYSEVTQTITLPSGLPYLSFWIKFFNPDGDDIPYDFQQALIVHPISGVTLIDLFSSIDGGPDAPFVDLGTEVWTQFTVDVSAYAGTSVKLLFRTRGDGSSDPSWMLVDDISTHASGIPKGEATANQYLGGVLNITATLGLISGSTSLTLIPNLISIAISVDTIILPNIQYLVTGIYDDASTRDVTTLITSWMSSNTGVATIDGYGLATIVGAGTTNITASFDIYSDFITLDTVIAWGTEALYSNPPSSVPGIGTGYASSTPSTKLYIADTNNVNIITSSGNGTWVDQTISLGSPPGLIQRIWSSGATVLAGAAGGTTSNAIIRSTNSGSSWATIANSYSSDIRAIHGSSLSNIWAGGAEYGVLIHSTDSGSTWSSVSFPGGYITAIFAISSTDVWIGGADATGLTGVLYHYNGTTFTSFYSALNTTATINSIWASSTSDIYIGAQITNNSPNADHPQIKYLYHSINGGTSFTLEYRTFTSNQLSNAVVFGTNSTSIYSIQSPTQLLHSNGSGSWTRENVDLSSPIIADRISGAITLLGLDDTNIWAAGNGFGGGSITHAYIIKRNATYIVKPELTSIIVSAGPTAFINGYPGGLNATDTTIFVGEFGSTDNFPTSGTIKIDNEEITYTGISGFGFTGCTRGANSTVAATHAEQSLIINLKNQTLSTSGQFNAIGIYSDGRMIELTSDVTWSSTDINVAHISNSMATKGVATKVGAGTTNITATLNAIDGYITITAPFVWTTILDVTNDFEDSADFGSIFAYNDTQIWAGCFSGSRIYYYDGTNWNNPFLGGPANVQMIYSPDGYIVLAANAEPGTIMLRSVDSGLNWTYVDPITFGGDAIDHSIGVHGTSNSNIWGLFVGTSTNYYVAKSIDGGVTWTDTSCPITGTAQASHIWANSSTDVWIGDWNGNVYRWNGTSWLTIGIVPPGDHSVGVDGIWGTSSTNMYFSTFGASFASVVHWNGSTLTQLFMGTISGSEDYWTISGYNNNIWVGNFIAQGIVHSSDGVTFNYFAAPPAYNSEDFPAVTKTPTRVLAAGENGHIIAG